ncbi:MAG: diguanylate cyclase [Campylobacterales bacterium]|nr:diguanylate cyclase [Campylobacterales bacterium]
MESLQLKTKLLYLLLSVAFGLVIVGFVGYYNLYTMKKNVDTLYFGSLIPLNELESLNDTYHHELEVSVYRWNQGLINNDELANNLTLGLEHVNQNWASYISHDKRPEELPYIHYTETQIETMQSYFEEIQTLASDHPHKSSISLETLSDNITSIHTTISKLITYEISAAQYERSTLLAHHQNSLMQLAIMLGVILLGVMTFAWHIFMQIERQQQQLLQSAQTLQHLNTKLEHASYTDTLTGIFNRRYFNLVYEREFKRALRSAHPITFIMVDIDFFKQYNDTYGHLQGDIALQNVAHVLKSSLLRPGDFVFRLGGEEFGVILTDANCSDTHKMAERLRFNVETLDMEHKGNKNLGILTISLGAICITPIAGMNNETLLQSADTNLYAAKERGRNQVVFATTL